MLGKNKNGGKILSEGNNSICSVLNENKIEFEPVFILFSGPDKSPTLAPLMQD